MSQPQQPRSVADGALLPNLCHRELLLPMIVLTEGFAITISLVNYPGREQFWGEVALFSLYMQWITLSYSLFTCLLRPLWRRLTPPLIYSGMFLMVPVPIFLVTTTFLELLKGTPVPLLFSQPDEL